jgi:protein SCO1/2
MSRFFQLLLFVLFAATFAARGATRSFVVHGMALKIEPNQKTIVIQHDAIPGYMAAMTMPFQVKNPSLLQGIKPGDAVSFTLIVTDTEGWIESLTRLSAGKPAESAPTFSFRRALPELGEGDLLPDYHFTNELGKAVRLQDFRGQMIAFTFFFTSCPYPDFCPRMTSNFHQTETMLENSPGAPSRWHLFSISFDPANDTPARLAAYAHNAHYDPAHWSFLTGDTNQIGALADQLGENFWREGQSVSHNLRTVVVDEKGRIRKIFPGNRWTPQELLATMVGKQKP